MSADRDTDLDPIDAAILAPLAKAARRNAAQEAGPGPTPAVWHRLQLRRAAQSSVRRPRALWLGVAATAVAAAGIGLYVVPRVQQGRPLTYAVAQSTEDSIAAETAPATQTVPGATRAASPAGVVSSREAAPGGAKPDDGYIRGVGPDGTKVAFSDGTRIDLRSGARLSVLSRSANGARLRVEDGEAHFEVVHRERTAWSVEAGPFVVYVTGTSFDVRWSGSDETVEVRLRSGSVRVGGPLLPERVTLRPGQRLVADLAKSELRIDEGQVASGDNTQAQAQAAASDPAVARNETAPGEAEAEAESASDEAAAADPVVPARAPSATRLAMPHRVRAKPAVAKDTRRFEPSGWATAVAAGDGKAILGEAESHGIERTLAEVDGAALAALADAARYGSRPDLAARALLTQRGRFPGTPAARAAAFYLGKLTDDRGDAAGALDWYRRYLAEAPRGPFAAEALGREMLTVERLSGRAAAHDLAAQYVRRFPNGTYLLQAHSILANP
jgi:ferric-dicitrate binding protein FerR (iron transport regulator)